MVPVVSMMGLYLQFLVLQELIVLLQGLLSLVVCLGCLILADTSMSRRLGGLHDPKTGLSSLMSLVVLDLCRTS